MSGVYFKCWLQIHTDQQREPEVWFCREQKRCPFKPTLACGHGTANSRYLFPKESTHQDWAGWDASSGCIWTVNAQIWSTQTIWTNTIPFQSQPYLIHLVVLMLPQLLQLKSGFIVSKCFPASLKLQKSWNTNKVNPHCAKCFYLF